MRQARQQHNLEREERCLAGDAAAAAGGSGGRARGTKAQNAQQQARLKHNQGVKASSNVSPATQMLHYDTACTANSTRSVAAPTEIGVISAMVHQVAVACQPAWARGEAQAMAVSGLVADCAVLCCAVCRLLLVCVLHTWHRTWSSSGLS